MLATNAHYQEPFRVLSARGYTLGKFETQDDAVVALRTWAQAVAVIQSDRVVARREGKEIMLISLGSLSCKSATESSQTLGPNSNTVAT